jgi:hypothetical protein
VRLKTKNLRGEGFTVRFVKRPLSGKKMEDARQDNFMPISLHTKEEEVMERKDVILISDSTKDLWLAARKGDCYTIRMLVMQGADLEARDLDGRTAINIATQYNQQEALKTLLAAREMKRMAKMGDLPDTRFFRKFSKIGTDKGQ